MAHIQKLSYRSRRTGKNTFVYQARYIAPDGRERTKRFDRKVDAERWLDANGADLARGTWVDPEAGRIMVASYADQWLQGRTNLRPTTRSKYRGLLDRHIIPALGSTSIGKLSPSSVRSWHATIYVRHPATAAGAYRLLSAICRTAVDDDLILRSPCRVKGASTERAPERPTASVIELGAAVDAAPPAYKAALLLAGWCQLRRSEVLGLQRRDIDMDSGILTVERAWVQLPGGGPVLGAPKTRAGQRSIAIPVHVLPMLEAHLADVGAEPTSWLFPGQDGNPVNPHSLDRIWRAARSSIGRPDLRFHDLRHSGLTWAASTGASLAELMKRAGHDSPAAAIRYQHATMDRDRVLADALTALVPGRAIMSLVPAESHTDEIRTKLAQGVEVETSITPLTRQYTEQSQRGSNPCSHLERVVS